MDVLIFALIGIGIAFVLALIIGIRKKRKNEKRARMIAKEYQKIQENKGKE